MKKLTSTFCTFIVAVVISIPIVVIYAFAVAVQSIMTAKK